MMKYLIISISSYLSHIIQLAGENKEYWKVKKTKQKTKQNPLHSFIHLRLYLQLLSFTGKG